MKRLLRKSIQPQQAEPVFSQSRFALLRSLLLLVFLVITVRSITIILIPPSQEVLAGLAKSQYKKTIKLSPYRGPIFDRRGDPLAISIRRSSFFINPKVFSADKKTQRQLAKLLGVSRSSLAKAMRKDSYFAWLKRKLPEEKAVAVRKLNMKGLHEVKEPSRYYPAKKSASQLIGFVGVDNQGLFGLEQQYDSILSGNQVTANRSRDARGRIIYTSSHLATPEKSGHQIYLTIDRAIQDIAQTALEKGIRTAKAKSGFAIVSDPHTGKILAVANYPEFDPNIRKPRSIQATRNHALSDLFEPGSVIKPLVVARAMDLKKVKISEVFETDKGVYREDRWRIRDSHPEEKMTVEEIIIESSNIGVYKIAKKMGAENLYKALQDFGVESRDHLVGFPQQAVGRLQHWKKWRSIRFANISFGQGFLSSSLEMVQAYGAIANGGTLMKPIIIDKIHSSTGDLIESRDPVAIKRIISSETAKTMRETLEKVVSEGTGSKAKLEGYSSAGKTGTTEKVDPETGGYSDHLRLASFVGFAPVEDPHLVIYVVVDEPTMKPYYGGLWAAPVFSEIANKVLRYLNVTPDQVESDAIAGNPNSKTEASRSF